jgi:tetratricopeptide (TPR) repeat protein
MPQVVLDQYTGVKSPEKNRPYGEIYLRRGIIAYLDNDVFKSRNMLETAERFLSFPGQEVESIPEDQKLATAFTQFYLALIQKNYGKLTLARDYIERSYAVYGQDRPEELLTPVTRAEILSYLPGEIDNARTALNEVLERADKLQRGGSLEPNDADSALRARLLLGNTYYVEGKWKQALDEYEATLGASAGQDSRYYVYHSMAQVYHQQKNKEKANEYKRQAYDALIETEHLVTKVALDTQILLNALAYLCTRDDQPEESEEYKKTIRKLWLQIVEISGLQLRLFSFEKKRPISKDEFWTEVFS